MQVILTATLGFSQVRIVLPDDPVDGRRILTQVERATDPRDRSVSIAPSGGYVVVMDAFSGRA